MTRMAQMRFNREADDRQRLEIHESWDNITCQAKTSEAKFIFTRGNKGNDGSRRGWSTEDGDRGETVGGKPSSPYVLPTLRFSREHDGEDKTHQGQPNPSQLPARQGDGQGK